MLQRGWFQWKWKVRAESYLALRKESFALNRKTNFNRFGAVYCQWTSLIVEVLDVSDVWDEQLAEDWTLLHRLVDQRKNDVRCSNIKDLRAIKELLLCLGENIVWTSKLINTHVVTFGHKVEAVITVTSAFSIVMSVVNTCVTVIVVWASETSVGAFWKIKIKHNWSKRIFYLDSRPLQSGTCHQGRLA